MAKSILSISKVVLALIFAVSGALDLCVCEVYGQTFSVVANNQPSGNPAIARSVPFCTLVSEPSSYDRQAILTSAILVAGEEQWFLYDPECNGRDKLVWAENDPDLKLSPSADQRLRALLARKSSKHAGGRAKISILGYLLSPGGKRFGHLDQFRMKFVIKSIEQMESVRDRTAWPLSDVRTGSDTGQAEETIRLINLEFMFHVAGSINKRDIPREYLANEFIFADLLGLEQNKAQFLAARFPPFNGKIYNSEVMVNVSGNTAVVTGLVVKSIDDSITERYRYANRYVRRGGIWQIISSRLQNP